MRPLSLHRPGAGGRTSQPGLQAVSGEIPPELVRQVADRLYARLLLELRLERERAGKGWLKGGRK